MMETGQPPIDLDQGLRYYGGESELFYQTLGSFDTMTLDSALSNLHKAWKAEDYETCKKEVFKLKGAADTIAAKRFKGICKNLEDAAINKDKEHLDRYYGDFLVESQQIKVQIARLTETTLNMSKIEEMMHEYNVMTQPGGGGFSSKKGSNGVHEDANCGGCALV